MEQQRLPFLFPLQMVYSWLCSHRLLCRTLSSEHSAPQTLHIGVWLPVDKLILQLMVSLVLMKPISLFLKLMGVLRLVDIRFWKSQTMQSQGIPGSIAIKGLMDRKFSYFHSCHHIFFENDFFSLNAMTFVQFLNNLYSCIIIPVKTYSYHKNRVSFKF